MIKKIFLAIVFLLMFQSIALAERLPSSSTPGITFIKYTFHGEEGLEKVFKSTIWQAYCDSDTGKTRTNTYYMEAEVFSVEVPYTTQPTVAFTVNYFAFHPNGTRSYITTNTGTAIVTEFYGIGKEICNSWLYFAISFYQKGRKD